MKGFYRFFLAIVPPVFMLSCSSDNAAVRNPGNVPSFEIANKTTKLPVPTAERLPSSWKGFNLLKWEDLVKSGGGAMIGEWGSHNRTPHDVVLAWMEDSLQIFKEAGMGWALWNFNGSLGVLNSERADVDYENFNGYKLDRKMLALLQKYLY